MLETLRRNHETDDDQTMAEGVQEWFGYDKPDGRNPGVGKTESIVAYGAAIATTFLVRRVLHLGWRTALDRDPPKNPASHSVAWKEALVWGAVSGALVGMARIGSRRASSAAYRKFRA